MRGQNLPPPLNNMLVGVITSTISWWGVTIRRPPMNNTEHQLYLHEGSKPATPSEQFVEWGDSITLYLHDDDDEWCAFRHSTFGERQKFATLPRFRRGATSGLYRTCLNLVGAAWWKNCLWCLWVFGVCGPRASCIWMTSQYSSRMHPMIYAKNLGMWEAS